MADIKRGWILARSMFLWMLLLTLGIPGYAQGAEEYTLFVGEFENRTDIVNPLLDFVNDTLDFLFSRSQLASIHPVSPGLRSACLQRARYEQPNVNATQLNLLAAEYGKADAVLVGSYTKTGAGWSMDAQLYVTREGSRAKEDIHPSGKDVYSLLDSLAAEVSKRLGTGEYMLLSTPSWEAYEAYRLGHQAYYNFNLMGAMTHFQRAIGLDPRLAIARAELGLSYGMISKPNEARAAFAEATKSLQYASEQEQLVVMGLESFYRYYWVLGGGGAGLSGADIPRMREDTVWSEPWLNWYITETTEDAEVRNRAYKQWLTSALAYAKAGFYHAPELAIAGILEIKEVEYEMPGRCVKAFNHTKDPQFLEAALQFIEQAAEEEASDEYDDAWKHWELSRIYNLMDRDTDVQQQREKWLRVVKSRPLDNLSLDAVNDIARKCLEIGLPKDAFQFARQAFEAESDPGIRTVYLVTLADAHLASGELDEAFGGYVDAFEIFARGDASTGVLDDSLSGLTRLIHNNPEFVDELKCAKLNEMMKTIESMDPLLFRQYSASGTIGSGFVLGHTKDFCLALGDTGPVLTLVRGMLKAETDPSEQLQFLSYLSLSEGGLTESELGLFEKGMKLLERDIKEEKDASLRLKYKYTLFSLYQRLGKYDEAEALVDGDIILEAEDAVSITPRLRVEEDKDASNGKCIGSPDTDERSEGEAEYTFQVSKPGDYKILGRKLAPHGEDSSFFVSVDDGERYIWAIWESTIWQWSVVTRRGKDRRDLTFNLTVGKHTLRIGNRDDGTKLDMIVITPL